MPLLSLFENLKLNNFEILCENTYIRRSKKRGSSYVVVSACPDFFPRKKVLWLECLFAPPSVGHWQGAINFDSFSIPPIYTNTTLYNETLCRNNPICALIVKPIYKSKFSIYVFGHMDSLIKEVEMECTDFRTMFHISICRYIKEKFWLIAIFNIQINYFLRFSRVVTLISLLAALKETCSPDSLHIYSEQGHNPQKCNASKGASKSQ